MDLAVLMSRIPKEYMGSPMRPSRRGPLASYVGGRCRVALFLDLPELAINPHLHDSTLTSAATRDLPAYSPRPWVGLTSRLMWGYAAPCHCVPGGLWSCPRFAYRSRGAACPACAIADVSAAGEHPGQCRKSNISAGQEMAAPAPFEPAHLLLLDWLCRAVCAD